jgi:Ran GTPase-activating protein (RanGAP) involved in mRNA processing and transport
LQDHLTLEDAGMPTEHALAEGVIQLYAQKLKKVVVADELQIAPGQVTDSELAVLCDSIRDDPPDILVLCGCCGVTNISCLVQLSTISHLDISGCNLKGYGGFHLAGAIKDMGAMEKIDISSNNLGAEGGKALAAGLKGNQVVTELNISYNRMGQNACYGVIAIADAIPDMGAISSVNLLKNDIGVAQAEDLVIILKDHPTLKSLCGNKGNEAALDMSGKMNGAADAIMLVAEIIDNGALSSLNLASTNLGTIVGWAHHPGNGDEYKFMHSEDGRHQKQLPEGEQMGKPEGLIAIVNAIPDMRALTSINVKQNNIPATQEEEIYQKVRINRLNLAMSDTSLTALDVSGIGFGGEGVPLVAQYISGNRALTKLDISENRLHAEGIKALAGALKGNQVVTTLNIASNDLARNSSYDTDMSGVAALADVIPGMGAMTKFDISSNNIWAEGGKALAAVLKGNQVITELNFGNNNLGYSRSYNLGYNLAGRRYNRDTSFLIAIADAIADIGALRCVDDTLYQSEKSFMMSTHVCCHCGQHKTQHTSR